MASISISAAVAVFSIGFLIAITGGYFRARRAADASRLEALDAMFRAYDKLVEAGDEVADEILRGASVLLKYGNSGMVSFTVSSALAAEKRPTAAQADAARAFERMRPELRGIFEDFLSAWIKFVVNRNLLVRLRIRQQLGRSLEKDRNYDPFGGRMAAMALDRLNGAKRGHHGSGQAA